MTKKFVILSVMVAVTAVALFFYLKINQTSTSYEVSGRIEEVKDGSIVVSGTVKSLDPADLRRESRTIEFEIAPQTVLKTNVLVITSEQLKSGSTFSPETQQRPGAVSDLASNLVVQIWSKDDLFTVNKVIAAEIHYISYDLPE